MSNRSSDSSLHPGPDALALKRSQKVIGRSERTVTDSSKSGRGLLWRFFYHLGGIGFTGPRQSKRSSVLLTERFSMQPQVSVSHKDTSPRRPDSEAGFSARTGHEEIQSVLSSDWPVVSIRWVDAEARGGPGWEDPEDMIEFALKPLMVVHSVGLLIHSCDQYVALTDSRGPDQIGGVQKIPRAWINSMDLMAPSNETLPSSLPLESVRTG